MMPLPPMISMPGAIAPGLPGMPGMPGGLSDQDNTEQLQAGITAFQQLTAVHTIFRTPIMAPHFANSQDENSFFYANAADLKTLRDLMLPIQVQVVVDMVRWLQSINPSASYPPAQWLLLVRKLILNQKISFPGVEIPTRIINFLSSVLRVTVTGAQENTLQASQDSMRKNLYAVIDSVSKAQAAFHLAVEEASPPSNVVDPVAWAWGIMAQATFPAGDAIVAASQSLATAKDTMNQVQDQINALDEQMASLQNTTLSPDQLAIFLIANLPASAELDNLKASYKEVEDGISLYQSLTQPIQVAENQERSLMSPYQDQLANRMRDFVLTRGPINYSASTGQPPTQEQLDAYTSAQNLLMAAQSDLKPFTERLNALEAQMVAVFTEHPEFMVNGLLITDSSVIGDLVMKALTEAAAEMPSDLMSIVQSAMQIEAVRADARTKVLESEQAEMIQAKQEAFQQFYQDKVEANLKFYKDQMASAQSGYNALNLALVDLSNKAQDIQDEINDKINRLGQVIGWWCHVNNISDSVMDQPRFIGIALNAVVTLQGKFDTVDIPTMLGMSTKQTFWGEPGLSSQLASETLVQMGNLDTAKFDYETQSPGLIAQMNMINEWMSQLQEAFKITQEQLNSTSYAQSILPEFNSSVQGALLEADIKAIVNPLRQISLTVQSDHLLMDSLLSDLEKQVLSDNGCNLSDIGALSYTDKKHLWVGVCDHLKGPGSRLSELHGYIEQMTARINARTPLDGDSENLQAAKVALMNILAAQNIQRTLVKDIGFMAALNDEAAADTTAAVENAKAMGVA